MLIYYSEDSLENLSPLLYYTVCVISCDLHQRADNRCLSRSLPPHHVQGRLPLAITRCVMQAARIYANRIQPSSANGYIPLFRNYLKMDLSGMAPGFSWLVVMDFRRCVRTYLAGNPSPPAAKRTSQAARGVLR